MGKIGRVFARGAEAQGWEIASVTRVGGVVASSGPIVLCMGEDDLEGAVARFSRADGPRLVFVQNGLLVDVMQGFPGAGRALLHFNADAKGHVRVLMPSIFGGATGEPLAEMLSVGGIPARYVASARELCVEEIRKLLWSTVLSVLAAVRSIPVGRIPEALPSEMESLARECIAVAAAALKLDDPPVDDLLASLSVMARALPDYAGSKRGQRFRNRLLVDVGRRFGVPTPRNEAVVRALDV